MPLRHLEERVVILAPVGRDGAAMATLLRPQGIGADVCDTMAALCQHVAEGAGALVLTEEAFEGADPSALLEQLRQQPPWSELPLIILTRGGETRIARLLEVVATAAGGLTLLERPLSAATLLRAVDVALRSRRRQYQVRDLLHSKAQLAAIVESSDDAIYAYDGQRRVLSWNRGAARLFGWPAADIIGRPVDAVVPPECAEEVQSIIARVLRGDTVANLETVCCRRDGTRFDAVLTASPVRHGDRPVAVSVIARDVTSRKQVEEALRVAGLSFRQLVERSPFGVYAVDADFRLVMVSAGAQGVFRNVRPLLGRDFEEVLRIIWPEPFVSEVLQHFRHTLATGTPYHAPRTVEQRADSRATEAYDWKIERMTLPDGRPGAVCHFYDLSERQRHEAVLAASELRYRALLDATSALTWRCPPSTMVVEPQPSWMAFTGQTADEMLGDGWARVVHPDDAAGVAARWSEAVTRTVPFDTEYRVRRRDGVWRWMRASAVPVWNAKGDVEEWFGALVDISDQKAAEEQLRQADRQKDEFLAVLAHELRNPLAPIRMSAALLKTHQALDSGLARSLEIIERQVAHMARLLDDLLDVSRLSRGTLMLRRTRVSLRTVLTAASEVATPLMKEHGQRLVVQGLDDALELEGDQARLIQVFGNLLTNAAKYSPPHAAITITVGLEDERVVIAVQDVGAGIAAEHLESVFALFTQVDTTGQTRAGGLGIGLSLARRLVELHGGTITAASAGPGCGSTFTVRLPAAHVPRVDGAPPVIAAREVPVLRYRVLVVDDNADAADTIALLLEGLGCDVRTVYAGEHAIREADAFRPDVALVDLGLPDLDGREVCRRIRSQSWGGHVRLVALTGWGRDEDRQSTRQAGFDHHLIKPADPDVLVRLIGDLPAGGAN